MHRSARATAAVVLFSALATISPAAAVPAPLLDCGDKDSVGRDDYDRGFYVERFPGLFLDSVSLWMGGEAASRTITLTARAGTFAGPVVGMATTQVNIVPASQEVLFDFGHVVAPHGTITFTITAGGVADHLIGVSYGGYAFGPDDDQCLAVQTEGTMPPLSEVRRPGLAIVITGEEPAATVALPLVASDAGE
jgi:hypothetical protein